MHYITSVIVALLMSFQAMAQQSPPPPRTNTSELPIVNEIGKIIFDVAERKAIETFYRHLPSGTTGEVIKEVVKTATSSPAPSSTRSIETKNNDDEAASGHKNKGKKNKNKGNKKGGKNKMPPGLSKRKSLPPGLQKQLERNGTLPPGLAKRNLPSELETQLPPAQEGTERVIAGSDVVLIHQTTGIVLDIIKDIITK